MINNNNDKLSKWSFTVEEISAGVYQVRGVDKYGRSVETTGTAPDELLNKCKKFAVEIMDNQAETNKEINVPDLKFSNFFEREKK